MCAFTFNFSSKITTNPLINSTIVFYSPIPTISFLPHQKTSIRTKVTTFQTFKAKRTIIQTSRKAEPRPNWQLHVHVRVIAKFTTNSLIKSTIVFYSPKPTISFLPHQNTFIRTKVTLTQTFKAKRTIIQISDGKT